MSVSYHKVIAPSNASDKGKYDAHVVVLYQEPGAKADLAKMLGRTKTLSIKPLIDFSQRIKFKAKAGELLSFDASPSQRQIVAIAPRKSAMIWHLKWARQIADALVQVKSQNVLLDLSALNTEQALLGAEAIVAAIDAASFEPPKYTTPKKDKNKPAQKAKTPMQTHILAPQVEKSLLEQRVAHAAALTAGTNLVRRLAMMAGNDLDCKNYVTLATKMAKDAGLQTKFYGINELKKMGAGAFLAVAQGSAHSDAGILKITYTTKKKNAKLVNYVGKGVTFDTGGVNVKPGNYMFGMHGDMTGSAVALAMVLLAAKENWSHHVNAYLCITDNAVGSRAFRPNDVVTSLSGKTIEIIHTDAEGRMILSDTLHLASQDKPDLMIDFATLTGACIRAIGSNYSGVFSNRAKLHRPAIRAGIISGERVWPFPLDADYAEPLKSDIADIKQCRLSGGPDHIEASVFLQKFVAKDIPWLHVDLSACEHEGGLGHIGKAVTGFGVRFADTFTRLFFS